MSREGDPTVCIVVQDDTCLAFMSSKSAEPGVIGQSTTLPGMYIAMLHWKLYIDRKRDILKNLKDDVKGVSR